ncbi:hypothetical protein V491_06998 [Pseudogymnoascus sp. VKM F-3775]|nr:hypothetical protein V491_06998 [Pseudogymnoascus sp. VKM F-3775]
MNVLPLPPDPYKTLGVERDARLPEIKTAYRKLILKLHPGKVQDVDLRAIRQDEFNKVQQAHALLSNDDSRLAYDSRFTTKMEEERRERRERRDLVASAAGNPEAANGSITQREASNPASTASIYRRVREGGKERIRQRTEKEPRYAVEESSSDSSSSDSLSSDSSSFEWEDDTSMAYRGSFSVAPRPSYFSPSERRKLGRTNSSTSMDHSMRKMHYNMGSGYGGSEDEGRYRSGRTDRSRPSSRQRNHSKNRVHNDAYAPPKRPAFILLDDDNRANSSNSVDHSMRKMHYSMGSDYGESDDEGRYRSRTDRSRPSSRQRSHSRNRAHSDAYAPPKRPQFVLLDDDNMSSSSKPYYRSYESYGRPKSPHVLHREPAKECLCCLKQFRPDDIVSLACQHWWCSSCLSRLVQLSLDSAELWPLKCCSIEIPQITLLDNLDEGTKVKYQLSLDKQPPLVLKCPNCLESFSDLPLLLRHHEGGHLISETSPPGNETVLEKDVPTEQTSNATDVDSDTCRRSTSSQTSEELSPSTTIAEPDPDKEMSLIGASTLPSPLLVPEKIGRQWKIYQVSSIAIIFLGKATIRFLGFQTTAWFVLVLAAVATSITTSYSIQGLAPDPRPEIGDSNYYSLLSQSIIAICSLYYLMVPYLRGDKEFPVRALFYICWILSLAGAVAAPLTYSIEWTKSVWCGFGSALAQVAATAFLFEHTGKHDRKRSHEEKFQIKPASGHEEEEEVEKYTDAVEGDT